MLYALRSTPWNASLLIGLLLVGTSPRVVSARSPVKLQTFLGAVDIRAEGPTPFSLSGSASHLGKFTAQGEVEFAPGEVAGTLEGFGVAVFEAANGDLLVGNVTWLVEGNGPEFRTSHIHFSWSDSIEFSNEEVVSNTGRFIDDRPPGLVVIAIIAILIGLMVPSVQKVR